MRAIDIDCYVFPTDRILRYLIQAWGVHEGYLDRFGKNVFAVMGHSEDEYFRLKSSMDRRSFIDHLSGLIEKLAMPMKDFVEILESAGIERANLTCEDVETTTGVKPLSNDYVHSVISEYPDLLTAFVGADPHKGEAAVREVERAVVKLGFTGVTLYPFRHKLYASDEKCYPIYEKALELDVPVWIHTASSLDFSVPMDYGHPRHLDYVASRFPDLKIIAGDAGWPWMNEMVAVAWRHRNVYIALSSFRAKHITRPGAGFEPLLYYGDRTIRDKVVWGSTWIMFALTPKQLLEEMLALPLKKETLRMWLYENPKKLIR